jgi:hypothetical protein
MKTIYFPIANLRQIYTSERRLSRGGSLFFVNFFGLSQKYFTFLYPAKFSFQKYYIFAPL